MGKFNTYRYLVLKDDTNGSSNSSYNANRSIKPPRRLRKLFLCLLLGALCLMYYMGTLTGQTTLLDKLALNLGYESETQYAVIIDAGSSGTRVLAYKFRVPFAVFGPSNLELVEEFFAQSKPGLSAFAETPEKGAETVVHLIRQAEHLIPMDKRAKAPLIVRATAGLRLLPADKAEKLIYHVRDAISRLGYDVGADAVNVMEGSDEGIFIWYTVNLLHGLMQSETMCALDLGGGSTQITYELNEAERASMPAMDQFKVSYGGSEQNKTVYTHSYLNLGLLAARHGIMQSERLAQESEPGKTDGNKFNSTCVDPIVRDEPWTYGSKEYFISGAAREPCKGRPAECKAKVYQACRERVRRYLLATMDWEPRAGPRGAVAAMSYFYDVAADAGVIDVMTGGSVTIKQYEEAAIVACSAANVDQPWACIDLTYIATLLHDGYKIKKDEAISLYKKVDGHEVSWALGLAYSTILDKMHKAA